MTELSSKKQYATPSVAVCLSYADVITESAGAKYMKDDWNVMDI